MKFGDIVSDTKGKYGVVVCVKGGFAHILWANGLRELAMIEAYHVEKLPGSDAPQNIAEAVKCAEYNAWVCLHWRDVQRRRQDWPEERCRAWMFGHEDYLSAYMASRGSEAIKMMLNTEDGGKSGNPCSGG